MKRRRQPPAPDPGEIELFREAVGPVRPLKVERVLPDRPRPTPRPLMTERQEREVMEQIMDFGPDDLELESGEELLFRRPGLQHAVIRKLRRGQYRIEAELDLHGQTVEQARGALAAFLQHCRRHGFGCVRIIHGKGKSSPGRRPVLKAKVGKWLRQRNEVLGYCSARAVEGGTGALLVLLRRR